MDARIVDGRKIARVTDDGKLKVLVHGRDGDDLVPVKVSEDGYLMLATDVTVEGVTVDLGTVELNQGAPGQNPWPVTLSGNIVEESIDALRTKIVNAIEILQVDAFQSSETLYAPTVRTETPTALIKTPPKGAKGMFVQLYVTMGDATLAVDEGVRMRVNGIVADRLNPLRGLRFESEYMKHSYYIQTLIWYPGVSDPLSLVDSKAHKVYTIPLPLPKTIEFIMDINLPAEKSIKSEMYVGWLT